jgi:hypothetical protein
MASSSRKTPAARGAALRAVVYVRVSDYDTRADEAANNSPEVQRTRCLSRMRWDRALRRLWWSDHRVCPGCGQSPVSLRPASARAGLELADQRLFIDRLCTVTILPTTRPGRGFDPAAVHIAPKHSLGGIRQRTTPGSRDASTRRGVDRVAGHCRTTLFICGLRGRFHLESQVKLTKLVHRGNNSQ